MIISLIIYNIVVWVSFKPILDELEPVCILLSLITGHLITVTLLDKKEENKS